ncbi:pseudouridine synthase family protein [Mycoplasma sp. 1654_15]|uniref:pseudouridine synthase family protein n=1 Tax=Mycoplasma sp. 1654_15 TaxID=2725994 RepID=UPI00144932C3|nr:RluA family pseudouridine synthase [Mycoplasma sp. 1654_15]QJB71025.1 RluA family pseudouridine synthase [Mycoplasma sp. 1654_15]
MLEIIAKENDHGRTLLKFVSKTLENYSIFQIEKLFRKKEIKVNKKAQSKKYIIQKNDVIHIYTNEKLDKLKIQEQEKQSKKYIPRKIKFYFDVVYEDENILVLNKHINVAVHDGVWSLDNQVLKYLKTQKINSFVPSHVGRLDKATSGLIIYAKNYFSLVELNKKQNFFLKYYIFQSDIEIKKEFEVKINIEKNDKLKKMQVSNKKKSITAITKFFNVDNFKVAQIITGKKHQIRLTLEHLGFPIYGDTKYGGRKNKRLFLHSYKIICLNLEGKLKYLNNKTFINLPNW